MGEDKHGFYEFFAGGGMARAGLGAGWKCLFANDIDPKKAAAYADNWGSEHLRVQDVATLHTSDLPPPAALAWASFPCQDLSLAGYGAGLQGKRSSTFWQFWKLMAGLRREGRAPKTIVVENVCGALTSHNGADFAAIGSAIAKEGYRFGSIVADAVHFVPQSRPRLFIVAVRDDCDIPPALEGRGSLPIWHPESLKAAFNRLSAESRERWVWWNVPMPGPRKTVFADLVEEPPVGVKWHTKEETQRLSALMNSVNRAKVEKAKRAGRPMVGAIYRRTRVDSDGAKSQRAEIRFDAVAGCLRTPSGGSSRQLLMLVEGSHVRSRLLSPREAARLMGLPDTYKLPANYNEAYHLVGDGLVVPVIRHLAEHLLEPLLASFRQRVVARS